MLTTVYLIVFLPLLPNIVQSYKFSRTNITHEWSIESPLKNQSLFDVVSIKNRLVYEWITCDVNPRIILKSVEIGFAPCEIPIVHENGCGCGLASISLANGKTIVWMKDYNGQKSCWRLYFVDPDTCRYDSYRLEEYSDQTVVKVLGYTDEFDVFFTKGPLCTGESVCIMRYNDKGVNVENFTISHEGGDKFWLEAVRINQTDGYFYASSSKDNKTIVKFLDPKFQELSSLDLNHTIDGFSVTHGSVNLCYLSPEKRTLNCEFYDLIECKGNVSAHYEDDITSVEVFNLADGGFIVITIIDIGDFSFAEARYFQGNEYTSQRVELVRQIGSSKLKVKHSTVRDGVDCLTTWAHGTEKIVTKCFDKTGKNNQIKRCKIDWF